MGLPSSDIMGMRLIVVPVVFGFLATLAVSGRFWARWLKRARLQLNDYFILTALLFLWAFNALLIVAALYGGVGQHESKAVAAKSALFLKTFVANGVLYGVSVAALKLSILDFYLKVFRERRFKLMVFITMILVACYGLTVMFTTLLICRPLAYNWDPTIKGKCGDTHKLYLSVGIVNLLLDVTVVSLPMPLLWRLQMSLSKKLTLTFILGLGIFVCIVSILRIVSIENLDFEDLSYTSAADGIWSSLEPALGILCACMPIMQPVVTRIKIITSSAFSRRRTTEQYLRHGSQTHLGDQRQAKNTEDRVYPLSDIVATQNIIRTGSSHSEDIESWSQAAGVNPKSVIGAKKDFDVNSTHVI